jgi:hypothetical protein
MDAANLSESAQSKGTRRERVRAERGRRMSVAPAGGFWAANLPEGTGASPAPHTNAELLLQKRDVQSFDEAAGEPKR